MVYSLWGCKESDKTERLTHTHSHTHAHTRTHTLTHARAHTHSCPIHPIFWLPLHSDNVVLSLQLECDLSPAHPHVSLPDRSGDLEGVFIKGTWTGPKWTEGTVSYSAQTLETSILWKTRLPVSARGPWQNAQAAAVGGRSNLIPTDPLPEIKPVPIM